MGRLKKLSIFFFFLQQNPVETYYVNSCDQVQTSLLPTLCIIIFNSKNEVVWIMMSSMLFLFSFQVLEKFNLEVFYFWFFTEFIFGVVFDLVFQTYNNSHKYIFSKSNCSLIKFMAVFFGMHFLSCRIILSE